MNDSVYRISLDIHEIASQKALCMKKGDTARTIYITLREDGTPYTIADGCTATFSARKPDGNYIYNACTIKDNTIIYGITLQTAIALGTVECEVTLYDADKKQITSPRFSLIVDDTVYNGEEIVSSPEANALKDLVDEIEDHLKNGDFKGDKGDKGDKGEAFTYEDFTPEQLAALKGEKGDKGDTGATGAQGDKGDKGDPFVYSDFTAEQLAALKGDKGEKGDMGNTGAAGPKGDTGADGISCTHSWDGTVLYITSASGTTSSDLKGERGEQGETGATGAEGPKGDKGDTGEKGDAFTYADFTPEQLAALKGEKGDKGDKGDTGEAGPPGEQGLQGIPGETGPQGPIGPQGPKGDKGDTGAGFKVLGYYSDVEALTAAVSSPNIGDAYGIGSVAPYDIYIYDSANGWVNNGPLQGAKGDKGDAFTYADFTNEQLEALRGPQGPKGETGAKGDTGATGENGSNGISATHEWNGTVLTVTSASGTSSADLKGDKGDTGEQGQKGDTGTAGPAGAPGNDGVSCTHTWDGTTLIVTSASGTSSADLKGAKGDIGETGAKGDKGDAFTYEDFTSEQLALLKGEKGDTGEQGPQGPQGEMGNTGPAGADGVSCTHSWNGTVLTVTSSSGTSSADLKGEKGDTGEQGIKAKDVIELIYPTGSIYISVNSTNPQTFLGGAWEQLKDRFLLGAGNLYTGGATGGEATHTLTISEIPSHNHGTYLSGGTDTTWGSTVAHGSTYIDDNAIVSEGGGQAHNNMPPYLAVYMWKRVDILYQAPCNSTNGPVIYSGKGNLIVYGDTYTLTYYNAEYGGNVFSENIEINIVNPPCDESDQYTAGATTEFNHWDTGTYYTFYIYQDYNDNSKLYAAIIQQGTTNTYLVGNDNDYITLVKV